MCLKVEQAAMAAFLASARLRRADIFGDELTALPSRPEGPISYDDSTSTVGFIGPGYQRGGVLVLGIDPGNSRSRDGIPTPSDQRAYAAKRSFRDEGSEAAFQNLMSVALEEARRYPLIRAYWPHKLDEIAYTNVVPFRTEGGARGASPFLEIGFEKHVRRVFNALLPGLVVGLGVNVERRAPEWLKSAVAFETINRSRSLSGSDREAQRLRVQAALAGLYVSSLGRR